MWNRILDRLCCPLCSRSLELIRFQHSLKPASPEYLAAANKLQITEDTLGLWIEAGLLVCHACRVCFPIFRGLPVFLPYVTPLHREFSAKFASEIAKLGRKYDFANREPVPGERFVLNSFSKEWLEYDFDGVIWAANYEDHEKTFLAEIGLRPGEKRLTYLEVGCGIGITTAVAQETFQADAIGVDLSLAALKATEHWQSNPFLHFVQASAFYLPLKPQSFDVVYSHGVLHHTYSTEEAFKRVAGRCRPGGLTYLWVYGRGSIDRNLFRRMAYGLERFFRPVLSRDPTSVFATACLACFASGYVAFNTLLRLRNPGVQRYNFRRAMHAARDRFTPQFAYRHEPTEVSRWFREAGFDPVELVDWRMVPAVEQNNFERNVGVRGTRRL